MENNNKNAEPMVTANKLQLKESNHYTLANANKFVVLADGRLAKLVKPVKVRGYEYFTYRTNDKTIVRVNVGSILDRCF